MNLLSNQRIARIAQERSNRYDHVMRLVAIGFVLVLVVVAHANPRRGRGGAMFPMATADFKKLVDARFVMFKSRLEENMKSHHVTDAKREAARKRAATLQLEVMKKVDAVGADRTVTRPEAMQVRQVDIQGRLAIWKELGITPPKRGGADD